MARARLTLSDLRSTSWEEGTANRLVFKSQNYLGRKSPRHSQRRGSACWREGSSQFDQAGREEVRYRAYPLRFPTIIVV